MFRRLAQVVDGLRHVVVALLATAGAAALCGWLLHPKAFVFLYAVAAVLAVGFVWPWLTVRGVRGSLSFDRTRVSEGQEVVVRLVVRNRLPWSVWGLTVRGVANDEGGDDTWFCLPSLGGRTTREFRCKFVPDLRGEFPRRCAVIACEFPFGVHLAARRLSIDEQLLVWPCTHTVGPIPDAACGHDCDGAVLRNQAGMSGDVLGVRPFVRGDWLRRVHWRQTARHDRLIVCEFQSRAPPRIQIVLDTDPAVHAGVGRNSSRECSIRIAASFMAAWIGQGAAVEAIIDGHHVPLGAGPEQRRRTLDALARIPHDPPPTHRTASLAEIFDQPASREFAGSLQVVITTDRALRHWCPRRLVQKRLRFVLLAAGPLAGFPERSDPGALPPIGMRPWIWIDDPGRVPEQLRRRSREMSNAIG